MAFGAQTRLSLCSVVLGPMVRMPARSRCYERGPAVGGSARLGLGLKILSIGVVGLRCTLISRVSSAIALHGVSDDAGTLKTGENAISVVQEHL